MQSVLALLILVAVPINGDLLYEGSMCSFKGKPGTCKPIDDCQYVKDELKLGNIGYTEIEHCAFKGRVSLICCPGTFVTTFSNNEINNTVSISSVAVTGAKASCEKISDDVGAPIDSQILEGIPTMPGEFPHMAALGYSQVNGLQWRCGASLISEQYVLTAAHCVQGSNKPTVVRLGKTTLTNDKDEASAVDTAIELITPHPQYLGSRSEFDIALIKLQKTVRISKFVRPACLYTNAKEISRGTPLIATGWGITNPEKGDRSDILLKVNLTTIDIDFCNKTYLELGDRRLKSLNFGHMCTYGDGKDTCDGDSGGPLQIVDDSGISTIVGITSSGMSCGTKIPGVYTRVASFIDWIESIVWS